MATGHERMTMERSEDTNARKDGAKVPCHKKMARRHEGLKGCHETMALCHNRTIALRLCVIFSCHFIRYEEYLRNTRIS